MSSAVHMATIRQIMEAVEAECAEHDLLRRKRDFRCALEAEERWRQRWLRLRKTQLQPWLHQWMQQRRSRTATAGGPELLHPYWVEVIGEDRIWPEQQQPRSPSAQRLRARPATTDGP